VPENVIMTNLPVPDNMIMTNSPVQEKEQFWQDSKWMKIQWTNHFIKYAVGAYKINELHRWEMG